MKDGDSLVYQIYQVEGKMAVKDYRELEVYQLAFRSAVRIHELTKAWPNEERYSLTDQIRRSSRSVCHNIAEAWRRRRYPNAFVNKLSESDAEAAETEVSLDFALHFGYISNALHHELADDYDHICRQLTRMMEQPDKWTLLSATKKATPR